MKIKLGLLSGILMLAALVLVLWTVQYQTLKYSSEERALIQSLYAKSKEEELRQYVQIAKATVVRLAVTPGDPQSLQRQALALLSQMNFGNDGYFFVYDGSGRILLDPGQMQMPGVDFCEPDQPNGALQAGMLLTTARSGGGFVRYDWQKPSSKVNAPKLSYVTQVGQWGWILGAGIYLDDVNATMAQIDQLARQNIAETQRGISWIAAAAILLIGMGGMAMYLWQERSSNRRLRQLGSRLVSSQDDERARVAQELHDGVMQVMVSSKFLLEAAQSQLPPATGDMQAAAWGTAAATPQNLLDQGLKRLAEAMSEMRRVAHGMRPAVLDGLSLPAALGVLIEQLQHECPFALELAQSGRPVELPAEYGITLFRITQEAVGNARKHAAPSRVRVSLHFDATLVRLRVLDNGRGFDAQQTSQGLGLRSMRERVNHIGGRFTLHSGGYGTQIEVELPYPYELHRHDSQRTHTNTP